jgi:hypothetical protein
LGIYQGEKSTAYLSYLLGNIAGDSALTRKILPITNNTYEQTLCDTVLLQHHPLPVAIVGCADWVRCDALA